MIRTISLLALAALWIGLTAASPINRQGTSGAPITVGTAATKVLACATPSAGITPQRESFVLLSNGSTSTSGLGTNMCWCEPGPPPPACGAPGTGGTTAPTLGVGWPLYPGAPFPFNSPYYGGKQILNSEFDCYCNGATSIFTWEHP